MISTSFLLFALPVVAAEIAVLAETLRVMELLTMGTGPGFLGATAAMVAVDAHVLGVVFSAFVRACDNWPVAAATMAIVAAFFVLWGFNLLVAVCLFRIKEN